MTTAQDIITRALYPMRDAALEFFTNPELLTYVNEAQMDLALRDGLIQTEETIVSFSGVLALPADVAEARYVKNDAGVEGTWVDPTTFDQIVHDQPDLDSDSFAVTAKAESIYLWPASNGDTFTVGVVGVPAEITAVGNTITLSRVWDQKLVYYVRSRCYTRLGETADAGSEMALYLSGLREPLSFRNRNALGDVNWTFGPTVFDLDSEVMH